MDLTIVILTKNEEKHIVTVVENAKKVTEHVLVVDSGSTDNTVTLAEKHGAKVVFRAWDNDFAAQRNFALKHVKTDWILYLDADERLSETLIKSIKSAVSANDAFLFRFLRKNSAFGRKFNYGVLGPDHVVRMFPVGLAEWEGKVHEGLKSKLNVKMLDGHIEHYTYENFEQYLAKMNLYSSIAAKNNYERGKKASFIKDLLFRPFFAFVKMYILKGGILEGWLGFVLCLNYANYTLNKYVKLKLLNINSKY